MKNAADWIREFSWTLSREPGRAMTTCALALAVCSGCRGGSGAMAPPRVPLSEPTRLCNEPLTQGCRPVEEVETWMRSPRLRIVQSTRTAGGNQGAYVLTLEEATDPDNPIYFRAKWRAAASSGWANEPRHELVAYGVQKMLLRPEQYVIPPTAGYCFPLDEYQDQVDERARPSWEDPSCVYGYMTLWLSEAENLAAAAESSDPEIGPALYSEGRFDSDPVYARKLARLNAVAVLIHHNDAHPGQFLVASDPFRVFSVDHSLSLTSIKNPLVYFNEDWSSWRLPAMPEELAETLQALGDQDVARLAILETYERHRERLVARAPEEDFGARPWVLGEWSRTPGVHTLAAAHGAAAGSANAPAEGEVEGLKYEAGTLTVGATPREQKVISRQLAALQSLIARGAIRLGSSSGGSHRLRAAGTTD